jgi:hypothetical protein
MEVQMSKETVFETETDTSVSTTLGGKSVVIKGTYTTSDPEEIATLRGIPVLREKAQSAKGGKS